jgi:hypothetical protein
VPFFALFSSSFHRLLIFYAVHCKTPKERKPLHPFADPCAAHESGENLTHHRRGMSALYSDPRAAWIRLALFRFAARNG